MFRILVIDDEPDIRLLVRETLEEAGHEVEEAENGIEGLRLYRRRPFDLIITDIFMPEKDGLEVLRELRREPRTLPIIAISGGWIQMKEVLPMASKLGASEILNKPFTGAELLRAVKSALEKLR